MRFERTDEGYEQARRAAVWNADTPARFPDAVVQASDEADVVAAVQAAAAAGQRIGVRAGGHSWAGNHVRDGGVLLDVSRLNEIVVDAGAMTATIGPGVHGNDLLEALRAHDLFFPAGHCVGVGVGGYLLQGGYGWNGRALGPACMSVEAIDVVTAAGELIRADATQHSDLLWAARGAGPGFCGAVTRFHVRLHPRPRTIANGVYLYSGELLDDVFRWAHAIGPDVPASMELMLVVHRDEHHELEIAVTGPVFADTPAEASEVLALLGTCPVAGEAKLAVPEVHAQMADLYAGVHAAYPDDHHYAVDNMWTHADIEELLPGLRAIAETMPPAPSHMLWMNWSPASGPPRPDMAYSCEDETYIALYGVTADAAQQAANVDWATGHMRALEPLATGIQLADENLGRRPARFLSDANMAKLDALRAEHDPDGVFHPWMGRP